MRRGTGLCPWNIALVQLLFNILFRSVRVFYICLLGFGIVFCDRFIVKLGIFILKNVRNLAIKSQKTTKSKKNQ